MIVRIFRVRINEGLKEDFEKDFIEISIPLVKARKGLVSFSAGKVISNKGSEPFTFLYPLTGGRSQGITGNQRESEGIRGNQRESEGIRGNQRESG